MPKVIFEFNKEKDIFNVWQTCNFNTSWSDFKYSVPSKVLEIAQNKKLEECKQDIENYYRELHSSPIIEIFKESLDKGWNMMENSFFERLEKITKNRFKREILRGYVTVVQRCPYSPDEGWFMVSLFNPLLPALLGCAHEIFHLQFHDYYFEDIEKKIGYDKTHDLKEALTVLLNLEFKDLFFVKEKGYAAHEKLREFIKDEWNKEKDFIKLLDKCIIYLTS